MKTYSDETRVTKAGFLPKWKMHGTVAAIHGSSRSAASKKQWLSFSISRDGTDRDDDFVYFSITNLPDKTGVLAHEGDHLVITGTITSWHESDGRWKIELVAEKIISWDEYQARKAEKGGD